MKVRDATGARLSRPLPDHFQQEIDRVAMRTGAAGSNAYLEEWSWSDEKERAGDNETIASALIEELAEWNMRRG